MNAPEKIWVDGEMVGESGFASCFDEPMGGGYTAYVRADLVDGLVKIMEDFPGFTEDAAVGDAWVESLWAALKALESAEIGRGME